VRLSDPCPCGETNRELADCCFVGGKFVKAPKPIKATIRNTLPEEAALSDP
jgi:hypothetical protein